VVPKGGLEPPQP